MKSLLGLAVLVFTFVLANGQTVKRNCYACSKEVKQLSLGKHLPKVTLATKVKKSKRLSSKVMLRTLDRRYWHRFGISIVNFEYISYPVLVPLLCFLFLVIFFTNFPRSYFRNEHWSIFLKSCSSKLDKIREIIERLSFHSNQLAC